MKSSSENASTLDLVETEAGLENSLSPGLKEIQGNFAIEGIRISNQELLQRAAEFEQLKKEGKVRDRILRVLADRPFRKG
jgi:hypothetical protein